MAYDLEEKERSIYDDELKAAQEQTSRLNKLKELEQTEGKSVENEISNSDKKSISTGDIKKSEAKANEQSVIDNNKTESGGFYNPDSETKSDKLKDKLGTKAKGLLKRKRSILVVTGGGGIAALILLFLILIAGLKIPHFSQVLTASGYARLNGIMKERMSQDLFDSAATVGDGSLTLRSRTMLERIKGQNLNDQITNLGNEGELKFVLKDGNVTGLKLPNAGKEITLDSVSQEKFGKSYSDLKKISDFRERMTVRSEWVNQIKDGVNDGLALEPRAVRGRVTSMALEGSGFKYNRWINKARDYLGKTPEEASIKNTVDDIEEITGKNISETGISSIDELTKAEKNAEKVGKYIENNGGVFDKDAFLEQTVADFAKSQKIQEVASKVGIGVMIGSMLCMANQAFSKVDEIGANNELSASRMALQLPAAQDQTLRGDANDEAIGAEANTLTGAENSPYYQYATGQAVTGNVEVPRVTPKYGNIANYLAILTSPANIIPGGALLPKDIKDKVDSSLCGALLSPEGAVAAVAAEVIVTAVASIFSDGGAAAVEQGGGRIALSTIVRALGESIFETGKGLISFKTAGTIAAFEAYQLGLQFVAGQLGGTDFMGAERGAPKFERAAVGNNILQSKRMRGMGGAPLTNEEAKQVDQPYQKQQVAYWQNKSVFARYFSVENPYSLVGNLSAIAPTGFDSAYSSGLGMLSKLGNIINLGNIFKPILSVAGLNQKVNAADTDFSPYYDVVQWGYSPDEINKMRNDPSYSYFANLDHISEERVKQLDDKYGKCFDATKLQYDIEKMDECSASELRKNDEMFRYRLTKIDEETVKLLEQKASDIGN